MAAKSAKARKPSQAIRPPDTSLDPVTAYARAVVAGAIVAGPHVRNAARRHLDDLKNGPARGLKWDIETAQHYLGFFPDVLRLAGGQFEGRPFVLQPPQAFIIGSLFGWKRADGTRRFRRAYIEMGKGNGKSPVAAGIGLLGLVADHEPRAEIYAAGKEKSQAMVMFRDAVAMVDQSPALSGRLKQSGQQPSVWNLADLATGSFFRPISKDGAHSGPRPHIALCDELHEHPDGNVVEMLERGFKFRRQPLLVMITNSASDLNSICGEEHLHGIRVAAGTRTPDAKGTYVGEVIDEAAFSYVCALDIGDNPLTDKACWPKANPMLGSIITEEYLAGVVAQAKALPGKMNNILRLHFCVWTDADEAWMSRETLEAVLFDLPDDENAGETVYAGVDLSSSQDLTAVAFVVPTGFISVPRANGGEAMEPTFDAWIEAWTPADTLVERSMRDKAPYDIWERDGWLHATPGKQIKMDHVAVRIGEVSGDYRLAGIAYDRYAYSKLSEHLEGVGIECMQVEHPQGGRRRAKAPDAALEAAANEGRDVPQGLWMPGSLAALETLIIEKRIRIRSSPVIISACMSAAIAEDAFGNRWFSKQKATNRIDALVSLAMAVGLAVANWDGSIAGAIYQDGRSLLVL